MKKISFVNVRSITAAVVLVGAMPAVAGWESWYNSAKNMFAAAPVATPVVAPIVVAPLTKWQKLGNGLVACKNGIVNGAKSCGNAIANGSKYCANGVANSAKYCGNAVVKGSNYACQTRAAQATIKAASKVSSQAKAHPYVTAAIATSVAAATVAGLGYRWYTRHIISKEEAEMAKKCAQTAFEDMLNLAAKVKYNNENYLIANKISETYDFQLETVNVPAAYTDLQKLVVQFKKEYSNQRYNTLFNGKELNTTKMKKLITAMDAMKPSVVEK